MCKWQKETRNSTLIKITTTTVEILFGIREHAKPVCKFLCVCLYVCVDGVSWFICVFVLRVISEAFIYVSTVHVRAKKMKSVDGQRRYTSVSNRRRKMTVC